MRSPHPRLDWGVDQLFVAQNYCKEVIVSKWMKHPNILSIEGVAPELFEYSMVSQWMPNRDLQWYVTKHPGANRLDLVRLTH